MPLAPKERITNSSLLHLQRERPVRERRALTNSYHTWEYQLDEDGWSTSSYTESSLRYQESVKEGDTKLHEHISNIPLVPSPLNLPTLEISLLVILQNVFLALSN